MTRRKKNPFLAGALAGSMLSAVTPVRRRKSKNRDQIRPIRDPTLRPRGTEAKAAAALRSAESRLIPAPVAAGMLMRGPNIQFGKAPDRNGQSGLRLSGRQVLCGVRTDNVTPGYILQWLGAGTSSNASLTFDPDDIKTMPPPMVYLAEIFSRYCLRSCRIVYTPQCPTSQTGSIALAVLTDTGGFATGGPFAPAATLTHFGVMENSNSAAGPPWAMMSLDVPCDETLRFTYQSTSDGALAVAEERQDHAFGVVAAQTGIAAANPLGFLHIEYVMDFYELYAGSDEQSLRRCEQKIANLRSRSHVERKEVKTPAREETKATVPSLEDQAKLGLSGGCVRCKYDMPCPDHIWALRPPLLSRAEDFVYVTSDSKPLVQEAGSVKSRSLKA